MVDGGARGCMLIKSAPGQWSDMATLPNRGNGLGWQRLVTEGEAGQQQGAVHVANGQRGGAQDHQPAIDANEAVRPASDDPVIANTVADTW